MSLLSKKELEKLQEIRKTSIKSNGWKEEELLRLKEALKLGYTNKEISKAKI